MPERSRGAAGAARARVAAVAAAGAAVVCLLGTAPGVPPPGTGTVADGSGPERPVTATPLPATGLGAFLGPDATAVRRLSALERWLGGTDVRIGHTYLPGNHWSDIEGDPNLLRPWAAWRRAAAGRRFVLNVPMMERDEARLPDAEVRRLLRQAAAGGFDGHFRTLARHLVEAGVPDAVLTLGWEMNGTTYTHRCAPDPPSWKAYWKRIVHTMRAVPGQHFRFDFAPNRGTDAIGWSGCYPGDDVVDVIGMDSYDQPSGETFEEMVREPYGLQAQVDFAAVHKKQISYPEWGLFRNGDNAEFVARMLEWMARHPPLYQTITDYCPHGVWQCRQNPRSARVYRQVLHGMPGVTRAPGVPGGPGVRQSVPAWVLAR
ncbi:glycosyl hydrolase [Streptomyces sp. NPDC048506]|uniref:glycoside hydrolase family 26 protein n=1 Tax=Streptomyces sp. NPDC048506 TaxID=3155028 RepID=UPI0034425928